MKGAMRRLSTPKENERIGQRGVERLTPGSYMPSFARLSPHCIAANPEPTSYARLANVTESVSKTLDQRYQHGRRRSL